jgi:hypothetical protein
MIKTLEIEAEQGARPWILEDFGQNFYRLIAPSGILWNYKDAVSEKPISPMYKEAQEAQRILQEYCK